MSIIRQYFRAIFFLECVCVCVSVVFISITISVDMLLHHTHNTPSQHINENIKYDDNISASFAHKATQPKVCHNSVFLTHFNGSGMYHISTFDAVGSSPLFRLPEIFGIQLCLYIQYYLIKFTIHNSICTTFYLCGSFFSVSSFTCSYHPS